MPGELFQRRAERGEEQVYATDARFLKPADALPNRTGHAGFDIFPIDRGGVADFQVARTGFGAADEEDRAVGSGLCP